MVNGRSDSVRLLKHLAAKRKPEIRRKAATNRQRDRQETGISFVCLKEKETDPADDAVPARRNRTPMTPNGTSPVTGRNLPLAGSAARLDWVDYAKGICIVMVVMMHSVLGVEAASGQTGFMHWLVMFAKPFRMPDFFLISGLFLAVVIDRD